MDKKNRLKHKFDNFWIWIFASRPENPVPGVICCVESEFDVKKPGFLQPEAQQIGKTNPGKFTYMFFSFSCLFFKSVHGVDMDGSSLHLLAEFYWANCNCPIPLLNPM